MKYVKILIIAIIIIITIGLIFGGFYYFYEKPLKESFSVDTIFLKIAMENGKSSFSNIKIKNLDIDQEYSIKINNLDNFASVESSKLYLNNNEEKNLKLIFNDLENKTGVYLGELSISNSREIKKIPIIIEVQSKDVLFDSNVNLFPQARDIVPGESLNAEIKIYDLANIGKSSVKTEYFIKGFNGDVIRSESEDIVVNGNYAYSKNFDIPKNIKKGDYLFVTIISYRDSVGTSSVFFKVGDGGNVESSNSIFWIVIIFGILFFVFLGLFAYSLFYRDRVMEELQNQYKREIARQEELVRCQERKNKSKLKDSREIKTFRIELEKAKKERLKLLKEIQKKRIIEYRQIRKKGDEKNLKNQLNKWKSKGYNTEVLEHKYKLPDANSIKKKILEWKKKGYDTSVLERGKI